MTIVGTQLTLPEIEQVDTATHFPADTIYSLKLVSSLRTIRTCVSQTVLSAKRREPLFVVYWFAEYRKLALSISQSQYKKTLRSVGLESNHRRYVTGLSRRMLRAYWHPQLRAKRSVWPKRYEKYIKPFIRFTKAQSCTHVQVTAYITSAYCAEPVTVTYAFLPDSDRLVRLAAKPAISWRDFGVKNFQLENLEERIKREAVKRWSKYLTYDQLNYEP
jgi:hypothetical protein